MAVCLIRIDLKYSWSVNNLFNLSGKYRSSSLVPPCPARVVAFSTATPWRHGDGRARQPATAAAQSSAGDPPRTSPPPCFIAYLHRAPLSSQPPRSRVVCTHAADTILRPVAAAERIDAAHILSYRASLSCGSHRAVAVEVVASRPCRVSLSVLQSLRLQLLPPPVPPTSHATARAARLHATTPHGQSPALPPPPPPPSWIANWIPSGFIPSTGASAKATLPRSGWPRTDWSEARQVARKGRAGQLFLEILWPSVTLGKKNVPYFWH